MRANCEPVSGSDRDTNENPAEATAGLSENSDQADLMTGEDFVAAIRVILQACSVTEKVIDYARIFKRGRLLDDFDERELKYAKSCFCEAEIVYRRQIRVDFKKIVDIKKFDFEEAVLTLQDFSGGV